MKKQLILKKFIQILAFAAFLAQMIPKNTYFKPIAGIREYKLNQAKLDLIFLYLN